MKGLYAIVDNKTLISKNFEKIILSMIRKEIRIFQIRIKHRIKLKEINKIIFLKRICRSYNCKIIINDNIFIAKKLDLDGIHIGKSDISVINAKRILGVNKIIGVSCYNSTQRAKFAEENRATYVSLGSLYNTTTKKNSVNLKVSTINKVKSLINVPVCLIGGINKNNINRAMAYNPDLIAISKSLKSIPDIIKVTRIYNRN